MSTITAPKVPENIVAWATARILAEKLAHLVGAEDAAKLLRAAEEHVRQELRMP